MPRDLRPFDGPPFALPRTLDRAAEWWWARPPRARVAAGVLLVLVVLGAGVAHAARSPYGPPTAVLVATEDLAVGDRLDDAGLRRAWWPQDLVPAGARTEPTGVLGAPLPRGAVLTDRHLGDDGLPVALPAGTVAVAVPVESLPDLAPGLHLDLVSGDLDGRAVTLATGAVVLRTDQDAVWLAVDRTDAVAVTGAALAGTIGAIVLPP